MKLLFSERVMIPWKSLTVATTLCFTQFFLMDLTRVSGFLTLPFTSLSSLNITFLYRIISRHVAQNNRKNKPSFKETILGGVLVAKGIPDLVLSEGLCCMSFSSLVCWLCKKTISKKPCGIIILSTDKASSITHSLGDMGRHFTAAVKALGMKNNLLNRWEYQFSLGLTVGTAGGVNTSNRVLAWRRRSKDEIMSLSCIEPGGQLSPKASFNYSLPPAPCLLAR